MKRHLIDKLDTANTAQLCANRGEIHESHSCHCQKRCAKLLIQHDDPISPVSHYLFIMFTGLSGLFRFVLQESNIIFDWGHCGKLRNVFWGINTQTVDTVVIVQVCQCYLVQQLRVEFLWRANDPFINAYKEGKKITKALLPGAVLLRYDCETAETLFSRLHDLNAHGM